MNGKLKRFFLATVYALAMAAMAASLTVGELRPKLDAAATCSAAGTPCDLTNGVYACTGGINGAPPIPGCSCDLSNFCTADVQ
jgi:hypothetical protein